MVEGSNIAARIADLRRRIRANEGIADRADATILELRSKAATARRRVVWDQAEIEAMGGKVRR